MQAVRAPAVKHMTKAQFTAAIELGTAIAEGREDLCVLNERSLKLRGKEGRKDAKGAKSEKDGAKVVKPKVKGSRVQIQDDGSETRPVQKATRKRKAETGDDNDAASVKKQNTGTISKYFSSPSDGNIRSAKIKSSSEVHSNTIEEHGERNQCQEAEISSEVPLESRPDGKQEADNTNIDPLQLIATSEITPFRKEVLTLLCSIPPGKYTTYAAMARHVNRVRSAGKTATSETCARAIGNAMVCTRAMSSPRCSKCDIDQETSVTIPSRPSCRAIASLLLVGV